MTEYVKVYSVRDGDVQLPLVVPILYCITLMIIVLIPLVTKPRESAIGLAVMLSTGLVYYLLVITWTSKPALLVNTTGRLRGLVLRS